AATTCRLLAHFHGQRLHAEVRGAVEGAPFGICETILVKVDPGLAIVVEALAGVRLGDHDWVLLRAPLLFGLLGFFFLGFRLLGIDFLGIGLRRRLLRQEDRNLRRAIDRLAAVGQF